MAKRLKVFSDYICPWCYFSTVRIEQLRQDFQIDVEWIAFPPPPRDPCRGAPPPGDLCGPHRGPAPDHGAHEESGRGVGAAHGGADHELQQPKRAGAGQVGPRASERARNFITRSSRPISAKARTSPNPRSWRRSPRPWGSMKRRPARSSRRGASERPWMPTGVSAKSSG